MKKAQGLSLQMIVLAALALIILVVLMVIFVNKTKPVNEVYNDCEDLEGKMIDVGIDCPDEKPFAYPLYNQKDDEGKIIKKCCVSKFV